MRRELLSNDRLAQGRWPLFMVHRTAGHEVRSRPPRPGGSLFLRLAGGVVLLSAIAAGWVHWGIGTAVLFLVVFAVVYLPVLWR